MARNRQMAALRGQHARNINDLFKEFLRQNPTIEPHVAGETWTDEQTDAWREFTASENARFARERDELANKLRTEHEPPLHAHAT